MTGLLSRVVVWFVVVVGGSALLNVVLRLVGCPVVGALWVEVVALTCLDLGLEPPWGAVAEKRN